MMNIKKGLLVLLLITALLLGALGAVACLEFGIPGSGTGIVRVEKNFYDELTACYQKYAKAELLSDYLKEYYYKELNDEDIMTGVYRGIFDSADDPYTYYMTDDEYTDELIETMGNYEGVGITFTETANGEFVATMIAEGSPAEEAGIVPGDVIEKVDGIVYENSHDAAKAIRGKEGTSVMITIRHDDEIKDIVFTRRVIISKSVYSRMLEDGIGYIQITGFEENTAADFRDALEEIEEAGAFGFVLDLRDNGGGLVDASVAIADMLMDEGTVVYAEDRYGNREYYKVKNGRTDLNYTVLVNENSASASEILAVGIQSNSEAKIVGTQSFGKGIIQEIEQLSDGSAVKLTILQYFSPSGETIHKQGVTPDIVIEMTEDCYDDKGLVVNDIQLEKAVSVLKEK